MWVIVLLLATSLLGSCGDGLGAGDLGGLPPGLEDEGDGTDDDDAGGDDDTGGGDDDSTSADGDDDDDDDDDDDAAEVPLGFVGSPCDSDVDCDYDGGICLLDSFPGGTCSKACDQYCPDESGYPVTFCAENSEFPNPLELGADGGCLSRCDLGIYPDGGCRDGYGCVVVSRANEPGRLQHVCLPGRDSELGDCHLELAARGVAFEPTVWSDDHPSSHPALTCSILDPVWLRGPIGGIELLDWEGWIDAEMLASCEMALALVDTLDDVRAWGVDGIRHLGTYNCRVISGTDTLSLHGLADAIDISGFEFEDGSIYTLLDDWEHDTDDPEGEGGIFLYGAAHRWHDAGIWNVILTPNYNLAHDNHFHVDLTPGSDFLGVNGSGFIGSAPYVD